MLAQVTSVNPIRLKQELPPAALDEEYFRAGMENDIRRKNIALQLLQPERSFRENHSSLLRQKRTGIVRLFAKQDCTAKITKTNFESELLAFAKNCPVNFTVGNARNFSFRRSEYVSPDQSDLSFESGNFYANGLLNAGIMVSLGKIDPAKIELSSKELIFLRDFVPATDPDEIDKQLSEFGKGVRKNGFTYARGFNVAEKETYAIRSVAYRADLSSSKNYLGLQITFDPFRDDKRYDVIVVFQVVGIDDKGVTILWRELQRQESPKLKRIK